MDVIATAARPWQHNEHQTRTGSVDYKLVRDGELLPGVGSTCLMVRFNKGDQAFTAPRHHHDFEQIRITLEGDLDFGNGDVCRKGWVSYFPAGAFYGPELMDSGYLIQVQWSDYWVTREQNNQAIEELRKVGEFEGGIYSFVDADGKRKRKDGLNAVWEHVYKRPSSFPTPRYPSPILMNPDAFDWVRRDEVLSEKVLGRFTERDLILSKVRWDVRGRCELPAERTYCLFTVSGTVRVDGVDYGPETAVWSEVGEDGSLEAEAGTEAFSIAFPPRAFARISPQETSRATA